MTDETSEYPADVMDAARKWTAQCYQPKTGTWFDVRDVISKALLAERQRCADTAEAYRQKIANYPNQEAFNYYESGVLDASVAIKWLILNPKSSTEER